MPRTSIGGPSRGLVTLALLTSPAYAQLGSPWTAAPPRSFAVFDIEASPLDPERVVAMSFDRLALTDDGGATFSLIASAQNGRFADVAFGADGRVYAADGSAVRVSLDGGATFLPPVFVDDPSIEVNVVVADPADPLRAWAGLEGGVGLALTTDGGATWSPATPNGFGGACSAIAIDPLDGNRVVACQDDIALFITQNGGNGWMLRFVAGAPQGISHAALLGPAIVVATEDGLLSSINGGNTFLPATDANGLALSERTSDLKIVDPLARELVATQVDGRLLRSTDGGRRWSDVVEPDQLRNREPRAALARPGGSYWVGSDTLSLLSYDGATGAAAAVGGDSLRSAPLARPLSVSDVAIDPGDQDRMIAAASAPEAPVPVIPFSTHGVFTSTDGGATWQVELDLEGRAVAVEIGADGRLWSAQIAAILPGVETSSILANDGGGWLEVGPPTVGAPFSERVLGIDVAPRDPDAVVAVVLERSAGGERTVAWLSTDGAQSWGAVDESQEPGGFTGAITMGLADPTLFDGGVGGSPRIAYRRDLSSFTVPLRTILRTTDDGGATWSTAFDSTNSPFDLRDFTARGSTLYRLIGDFSAFTQPIESSTDGGATWTPMGPPAGAVRDLQASPLEEGVLYFTRSEQVVRATQDGADHEPLEVVPGGLGDSARVAVGGVEDVTVAAYGSNGLWIKRIAREAGTRLCAPAVENSVGRAGQLRLVGGTSVQTNELALVARRLPAGSAVLAIVGDQQVMVPGAGGSLGVLCVGGQIGRFNGQIGFTDPSGALGFPLDLGALPAPNGTVAAMPGMTLTFQCWYRDVSGGSQTSNYTDAVAVTFQP